MSKPYDASTKYLVETHLADWLGLSRRQTSSPAVTIDADLATVTAAADKVLRVEEESPWLFHLELQSSWEKNLPRRIHWYNSLLEYRHELPVHSLLVLLRREADAPGLTGEHVCHLPCEVPYRTFKFQVVRIWTMPLNTILSGGVGLLPLAPLCDEATGELPRVIEKLSERFGRDVLPEEAGTLWAATDILMGLRYSRELVAQIMKGVGGMKESVTYQAIVEEGIEKGWIKGKLEGKREILLRLGKRQLGSPEPNIVALIEGISDNDLLDQLCERVLNVVDWRELIAGI
jgi:predicted transposase YdaD